MVKTEFNFIEHYKNEDKKRARIIVLTPRKEKVHYILSQMIIYEDGRSAIYGLLPNDPECITKVKHMHNKKLNEMYHNISYDVDEILKNEAYFESL